MKPKERPIEGPRTERTLERTRAARLAPTALALAWLAIVFTPSVSAAQAADYSGPGVVPPAEAYVGGADESAEMVFPRWRAGPGEERTLRVYLSDPPPARPGFWAETIRAIDEWNAVEGVPVSFERTRHASAADVEFRWIRRFDARQAGTTDWETDGEGWLSSAVVTLAMEHEDGMSMSDEFLRLVALHELGHVIGLPHSDDPSDVMHPGNRSLTLSDRDIRSARQLYEQATAEPVSSP